MNVKNVVRSLFLCIIFCFVPLTVVADTQDEINISVNNAPDRSEQDYLQGLRITTPESAGLSLTADQSKSDALASNFVLESSQVNPVDTSGIQWQSLLGGSSGDVLFDIQETDGGYIAVGASSSGDGNLSGYTGYGSSDAWVVKFYPDGNIQWQKLIGGSRYDQAMSIREISDGYVFVGFSLSSPAGSIQQNHGDNDIWVVKLDRYGNKQWETLLGGNYSDYGRSIRQIADGGYIVSGDTYSPNIGGVPTDGRGIYAARLDSSGNVTWQKTFGGGGEDYGSSIIPASDGGFILTGYTNSQDFGDFHALHGYYDIFVMKLDTEGNKQWLKLLGGNGYDRTSFDNAIYPTSDGGYILTGQTTSYHSGDVGETHGSNDIWVVKIFSNGTIDWQRSYGGLGCEVAGGIMQVADGGYILTGQAGSSASGDVSEENSGDHDIWVVRLDPSGNILWEKLMGGNGWEQSVSIRNTSDGGYIYAGFTRSSNSGYIGTSHGYEDAWVVKLRPRLVVDVMDSYSGTWVPNVTVTMRDPSTNQNLNMTAMINGRVAFTVVGTQPVNPLVIGHKYTINASALNYKDSMPVNISFTGDGQRIIVNLTPLITNYTKSFSITCIENYDNIDPALGSIDECNKVALNLIDAGYKMNFYHKDGEVTEKDFATDPLYTGHNLTESAFHYHSGHGSDIMNSIPFDNSQTSYLTFLPLKDFKFEWSGNPPALLPTGGFVNPAKVTKRWGGANKYVMLDSCYTLHDIDWGNALTTSHGILGWTSYGSVRRELPDKFFEYAIGNKWKIKDAYKKATLDIEQTDSMNASIITKTQTQYETDHFPGQGQLAPDDLSDNPKLYRRQWECKWGNETW